MLVDRNIYYLPEKLIHPYHVRIIIKGHRFFCCCATLEEARIQRDKIIASVDNGRS